jgi:hypothetical protein
MPPFSGSRSARILGLFYPEIQVFTGLRDIFHPSKPYRPNLGAIQSPIYWVPQALSPFYSGRGFKIFTPVYLVSRIKVGGAIPTLPPTS